MYISNQVKPTHSTLYKHTVHHVQHKHDSVTPVLLLFRTSYLHALGDRTEYLNFMKQSD